MDDQIIKEISDLKALTQNAGLPGRLREKLDRMFTELERSVTATNYFETSERIRHYIDWIAKIPWQKASDDMLDLAHAKQILDEHHYGLEDVKTRIDQNSLMILECLFAALLKLLHPIMPFITEEIYSKFPENDKSIMISDWPQYEV